MMSKMAANSRQGLTQDLKQNITSKNVPGKVNSVKSKRTQPLAQTMLSSYLGSRSVQIGSQSSLNSLGTFNAPNVPNATTSQAP